MSSDHVPSGKPRDRKHSSCIERQFRFDSSSSITSQTPIMLRTISRVALTRSVAAQAPRVALARSAVQSKSPFLSFLSQNGPRIRINMPVSFGNHSGYPRGSELWPECPSDSHWLSRSPCRGCFRLEASTTTGPTLAP